MKLNEFKSNLIGNDLFFHFKYCFFDLITQNFKNIKRIIES
jgi:hypothetical protein